MAIVWSIVVLAGLGIVFGAMLGVAAKKFRVDKDERIDMVRGLLPGANCGGCGYPGCDGLAAAIVKDGAPITACAPLSSDGAAAIAGVMGVDAGAVVPKVARIMCLGSEGHCRDKFIYDGAKDCRAAYSIASGFKACRFACLGLGTCAKVCKFGAIKMGEDGIAFIDEAKCTGCGCCVEQCPQSSIAVLDRHIDVYAGCTNIDKGKSVTENCSAGCIGCGICAKNCPFEAIAMKKNLPVVDYEKCRSCWVCVEKCPRKCILTTKPDKIAVIDQEKCIKCNLCKKACPFGMIEGEVKQPHKVLEGCRGCGLCTEKCKKDAIHLVQREGAAQQDAAENADINTEAETKSEETAVKAAKKVKPEKAADGEQK